MTNRLCQNINGENRNFFHLANHNVPNMEEFRHLQSAENNAFNQCRLFGTVASAVNPVQSTANAAFRENVATDLSCRFSGNRKRTREIDYSFTQRVQQFPNVEDFQQDNIAASGGLMPTLTNASLSLAALEDNRINCSATFTIVQEEINSDLTTVLLQDISSHLQQQKDEIDFCIRSQGEQLRKIVEEKEHQHLTALLAAVEKKTLMRLKDKELEAENVNRKNVELENVVKKLIIEAHLWQKEAKSNEALLTALQSSLQQAVALSREHESREGCGDSEDDDTSSSHQDNILANAAHAKANKQKPELKERKNCRVCRNNEVSILLLPCRHLCLCKGCEIHLNACPVCDSMKKASIQVFME